MKKEISIKDIKFDIGRAAFFMHKNKPECRVIYEIKITNKSQITCRFYGDYEGKYFPAISQDLVFASKEELLASL